MLTFLQLRNRKWSQATDTKARPLVAHPLLLTSSHFLSDPKLPKQCHQLWTEFPNTWALQGL